MQKDTHGAYQPMKGEPVKVRKLSKLFIASIALLVFAFALVGCGKKADTPAEPLTNEAPGTETLSGTLTVEGSDTMVNLAQAWAESFMSVNPDVAITVKGGGSGTGIASLVNGTVDFANASREVKGEEVDALKAAGGELKENAVARDGIAVIVNKANKASDLTVDQLGKIFRGEITDWKDVGGSAGKIVLLGRDTSSGTYEFFLEAVVGKDKKYSKEMRNLQSSQAIVDEVKKNPAAIGYVGMGYEDPAVAVLKVEGEAATPESVISGSYKLSRALYMDSNGAPKGLAKSYLDWITGVEGQKIVSDEGFVALR